jgi:hypothetical protein
LVHFPAKGRGSLVTELDAIDEGKREFNTAKNVEEEV